VQYLRTASIQRAIAPGWVWLIYGLKIGAKRKPCGCSTRNTADILISQTLHRRQTWVRSQTAILDEIARAGGSPK